MDGVEIGHFFSAGGIVDFEVNIVLPPSPAVRNKLLVLCNHRIAKLIPWHNSGIVPRGDLLHKTNKGVTLLVEGAFQLLQELMTLCGLDFGLRHFEAIAWLAVRSNRKRKGC